MAELVGRSKVVISVTFLAVLETADLRRRFRGGSVSHTETVIEIAATAVGIKGSHGYLCQLGHCLGQHLAMLRMWTCKWKSGVPS